MLIRRFRKIRFCFKYLLPTSFIFLVALIYCEFLHYYLVIHQCGWPVLSTSNDASDALHMMILADTHLLGSRNGHWFDKLRREWQMSRAFQTTIFLHRPDVVAFLGDLFDEGKWSAKEEFRDYVARFNSLFATPSHTDVLIVAGNHDMGFHYSINPSLSDRFEKAFNCPAVQMKEIRGIPFVSVNSMAMHGDDCFLCHPARLRIEAIGRELRCKQRYSEDCKGIIHSTSGQNYTRPILLQHYPLFRHSDASCSEPDEAPPIEKNEPFREKWECISKESTEFLLREIEPRLVLSGHTHHGCRTRHKVEYKRHSETWSIQDGQSILEYTVPSFSWRNKNAPTFAMMTVTTSSYSIYKCHMPVETTIILLYEMAFIFSILWPLRKKLKLMKSVFKCLL